LHPPIHSHHKRDTITFDDVADEDVDVDVDNGVNDEDVEVVAREGLFAILQVSPFVSIKNDNEQTHWCVS
jgi:hypothetical protein